MTTCPNLRVLKPISHKTMCLIGLLCVPFLFSYDELPQFFRLGLFIKDKYKNKIVLFYSNDFSFNVC